MLNWTAEDIAILFVSFMSVWLALNLYDMWRK